MFTASAWVYSSMHLQGTGNTTWYEEGRLADLVARLVWSVVTRGKVWVDVYRTSA